MTGLKARKDLKPIKLATLAKGRPKCKFIGCFRNAKSGNGTLGMCIGHGGGGHRCQHTNEEGNPDCTKSARDIASGMCRLHGGGSRCQHTDNKGTSDCIKSAATGDGLRGMCVNHGGGDRCKHEDEQGNRDCTKSSQTGNGCSGMCINHGGGNRCKHADELGNSDCNKSATTGNGSSDLCKAHGGGNRCQHENEEGNSDCNTAARNDGHESANMCILHGGGNRCQHANEQGNSDCNKSAVTGDGTAGMCVNHGGGFRCQHKDDQNTLDCAKSARGGGSGMCFSHGGGHQCQHQNEEEKSDCNQSIQYGNGIPGMCISHGGGNRCQYEGCNNSTQPGDGAPGMCISHGGGNRCQHTDGFGISNCNAFAPNGNGACGMCISHGGGNRCQLACCTLDGQVPTYSKGIHPNTRQHMCRFAIRSYISEFVADETRYMELMRYFGLKKDLVMRGEHAFYHALCLAVPELRLSERVLDQSILSKCMDKVKSMSDPRPDYFHFISDFTKSFGIHGEYDETADHEDSDERLEVIADASGCGQENVYVFRVLANHDTPQAVCKRHTIGKHHTYYKLTEEGKRVVAETAVIVRERLAWIGQGLAPSKERPWKVYINFPESH